ncbi:MAG TPA: X2-like carbohydrate binding domain-containing protein, partial [Clostridia bacterium]
TGNILSLAPGYLNYYFNKFQQDLKLVIKFGTGDPVTLTVKPLRVVESELTPREAKIDLANLVDVPVVMRLNGTTFLSVYNGASALNPGTDYTVSNNVVTIKKGYIKYYVTKFPTQNLNLIFKFSNGYDQILSLYIGDSPNTTITPASVTYKVGSKADINLTANMNGNFFSSIKNGTAALVPRVDYTYAVTTNTLLIKSSYLSYYFSKFHQNFVLQVNFTGGTPATLTIIPDWGAGTIAR